MANNSIDNCESNGEKKVFSGCRREKNMNLPMHIYDLKKNRKNQIFCTSNAVTEATLHFIFSLLNGTLDFFPIYFFLQIFPLTFPILL
jgi:hypothetical protein